MLFPHVDSRQILLRPARAKDALLVYEILLRLGRPGLPMVDTFIDSFGQGLSACFLIVRKDTSDVVGVARLAELTMAGHLRAEVDLRTDQSDSIALEAHTLTVNFAFSMWRTQKVYFHSTQPDVSCLGFGVGYAGMVETEAVLRDYTYSHGRTWDVHVFAIQRTHWDSYGVDLVKQIV
ncbi:hypothetical protein [Actinokineospora sp.]|uniref:hypothetical protein n=1 Tax=Actinokineospora sp. TaxID=1872133 RepID=UPI004037FAD4